MSLQESQVQTQDQTVDLREYWQIAMRYRWKIFALSMAITLLTALSVWSKIPIYRATASLLIEAQEARVLRVEEIRSFDSSNFEYFQTQFELLKSRQLAERVINKLQLLNNPEFNPDLRQTEDSGFHLRDWLPLASTPEVPPDATELLRRKMATAVGIISANLSIDPVRNTQLVYISYESESAKTAAMIANAIAQAYIDSELDAKMDVNAQARNWMNSRIGELKSKLEESEAKLVAFQQRENLVDVRGVRSLATKELDELTNQHLEARRRLSQAESLYRLIKTKANDPAALETMPEVLNHPSVQDLKRSETEQLRQASELGKRYGAMHPKIQAANAELETIRQNLRSQVMKLVTGIENEYQAALSNERSINAQIQTAKNQFQSLSGKENQYAELEREVESNRALYSAFFTRLKETSETGDFRAGNARIVDPAVTDDVPVRPRKRLVVTLAFIGSFALAVMLAFLLESLNDGVRSADDVERKLGQRLLGIAPMVSRKKKQDLAVHTFFDKDQNGFAEALRTIRTNVVLTHLDMPARRLAVTSTVPGEGKSTISLNIAFALGKMERVLLVDADMRRPSLGRLFGLPLYHPGLSDLITHKETLESCLLHDKLSGIDLIPAGVIPPNPQELLALPRFAELLDEWSKNYDRIVIDTPPTMAVSDALIVAGQVQSVLYVVKADSTHIKPVARGLGRLLQARARIDGIVLNQVDVKNAARYGDYHGYYDHYGYGQDVVEKTSKQPASTQHETASADAASSDHRAA